MKAFFAAAAFVCMLLGVPSLRAHESLSCSTANENIILQVADITLEEDRRPRIEKTQILIRSIAALSPAELESIDVRAIMLLAKLLDDSDNGVRMWVAAALSEFGYRAEPALPALERAYDRTIDMPISKDLPLLPSTSSRYEIGNAIETIKGKLKERAKNQNGDS